MQKSEFETAIALMTDDAIRYAPEECGPEGTTLQLWDKRSGQEGPNAWLWRATNGKLVIFWEYLHNTNEYLAAISVAESLCVPSSVFSCSPDAITQADILGYFSKELNRDGDEWTFRNSLVPDGGPRSIFRPSGIENTITLTIPGLADLLAKSSEFLSQDWYGVAEIK